MKTSLILSVLSLGIALVAAPVFAQDAASAASSTAASDENDTPASNAADAADTHENVQAGKQTKGDQTQTKTMPNTKATQEGKTNKTVPSSTSTGTGY